MLLANVSSMRRVIVWHCNLYGGVTASQESLSVWACPCRVALRRAYIKRHHEFLISVKSCTSLERTPDDSLRYQSVIFSLIRALDKVRRSPVPSLTDTGTALAGWPLYASLPQCIWPQCA